MALKYAGEMRIIKAKHNIEKFIGKKLLNSVIAKFEIFGNSAHLLYIAYDKFGNKIESYCKYKDLVHSIKIYND